MKHFTKEEQEYMDYLNDIYDCEPPYGLLLIKAYPEMFEMGMREYFIEKEHQEIIDEGLKDE